MYRSSGPSARTLGSRAKMSRAPQANRSASEASSARPEARSHRDPITMTVKWYGRGEPWVEIECRGQRYLRPGTMRMFELVLWLNGWNQG